jgi:hypothetical protein
VTGLEQRDSKGIASKFLERIGGHEPTRTTSHNSNIPNPHENLKPFIKAISQICKPNRDPFDIGITAPTYLQF